MAAIIRVKIIPIFALFFHGLEIKIQIHRCVDQDELRRLSKGNAILPKRYGGFITFPPKFLEYISLENNDSLLVMLVVV